METPYLSTKICWKRAALPLLSIVGTFLLFDLFRSIHRPTALFFIVALVSTMGLLIGESASWFVLHRKVKNDTRIADPSREVAPTEPGLQLHRIRSKVGIICWSISILGMLSTALQHGPPHKLPTNLLLCGLTALLTGIPNAIAFRWLQSYRKRFESFQTSTTVSDVSDEKNTEPSLWWTKDETRQEIRRR